MLRVFFLGGLFITLLIPVYADIIWNFDSDTEGWQVADMQTYGPYQEPLAYYSLDQY